MKTANLVKELGYELNQDQMQMNQFTYIYRNVCALEFIGEAYNNKQSNNGKKTTHTHKNKINKQTNKKKIKKKKRKQTTSQTKQH